jgi:DNA-binding LacI/PurR family transcriptional regulator
MNADDCGIRFAIPAYGLAMNSPNAARLSKATVSNVFSRPERVRPELRTRIESVARELGYAGSDPRGRLLSSGKVNSIGVVPPADGMAWVFADPYMR